MARGRIADIGEEDLAIFGLTDVEAKIVIGLVEQGPLRVSRLSREVGISHTTIHSALRRLREQGLVRRVSKGYASVWKVLSAPKIRKKINIALKPLSEGVTRETLEKNLGVNVSESTDFFVFQGLDALLKIYQWFFLNQRNKRVCCIKTTHSSETILQKLDSEIIAQLNDIVKMNKVVVEEVFADGIKTFYEQNIIQNKRLSKSIEGKATSVHLIPDEFLNLNADIAIAHDIAFLANWEDETLILIKNPNLIALLQNLFEFLKYAGKLFDQNAYIQQLIGENGGA